MAKSRGRHITRTFTDTEHADDTGTKVSTKIIEHDPVGLNDKGTEVEVDETP